MSKNFSICLVFVCFAAATSSPVMGYLIDNGDFEAVTMDAPHGAFDSWSFYGDDNDVVSTAPSVIDKPWTGDYSARMKNDHTGQLGQVLCDTGISHFELEFDFAVLSTAVNGTRGFAMIGNSDVLNIRTIAYGTNPDDAYLCLWRGATGGYWYDTGLRINTTPDVGSNTYWDDGEVPVVNHLKIVGTDYGTADAELSITLTGGALNGTRTMDPNSSALTTKYKTVAFGGVFAVDFMVDNVSCIIPTFPGDANGDLTVDAADAAILASNWLGTDKKWTDGDFNDDGIVNDEDFRLMATNWLRTKSAAAAIPEPCCMTLLMTLLTAAYGVALLQRT